MQNPSNANDKYFLASEEYIKGQLHQELFRAQHELAKFIELTFSPNAYAFDNNDPRG